MFDIVIDYAEPCASNLRLTEDFIRQINTRLLLFFTLSVARTLRLAEESLINTTLCYVHGFYCSLSILPSSHCFFFSCSSFF